MSAGFAALGALVGRDLIMASVAERMGVVQDTLAAARDLLDAYRAREAARLRELRNCELKDAAGEGCYAPLRWEEPSRAVVPTCAAPLDVRDGREVAVKYRRGRHVRSLSPDADDTRSCEDAALRAQLVGTGELEAYEADPNHAVGRGKRGGGAKRPLYAGLGLASKTGWEEHGRREAWGVLLEQPHGFIEQPILSGTLAAILRACPDLVTAERWRQAGIVTELARPWGAFERYNRRGPRVSGRRALFASPLQLV